MGLGKFELLDAWHDVHWTSESHQLYERAWPSGDGKDNKNIKLTEALELGVDTPFSMAGMCSLDERTIT